MFDVKEPASPEQNPYLPAGPPDPLIFEEFEGIDTQTSRPGVEDKKMAWCDGFMPIAQRKLRTLPGVGSPITFATEAGISFFGFANIGATPYCIVVRDDGSIHAVNTNTYVDTTIAAAGTITNPSRLNVGLSQWGSQYVLIVANQTNGYWLWDGSILYTSGTLGPVVTLTNAGAGYQTVPSVTASGGTGSGAIFAAAIANGSVTGVTPVNPGHGYSATDVVTLVFVGGTSTGINGSLTAVLSHAAGSAASLTAVMGLVGGVWRVVGVTVNNGGSGYSPFTTLTAALGGGGSEPIAATLSPIIVGGVITGATVVSGGVYFNSTPAILTVTDTGNYYVSSVTINNGGSGYSSSAVAACSAGGTPTTQATLSLTITAGVITGVAVSNGGVYGSNSAPTVTVTDSAVNATGTISLMPFSIQGTAVEVYQGRVWIVDGADLFWTAPGSFSDFSTANGGGNTTSSDSFLRVRYTQLLSTNGFLYLIADSSVNYISGVQTSGSPTTTTFTNQNADPEVGSPWPSTVTTLGRNILFANVWGVHVSYGASVTKVSDMLDGVYNTVSEFDGFIPSAAKAIIFGKRVWMLLLPILDPLTGARVNKLFLWEGKRWWASSQDVPLLYIQNQEIDSELTAWGTDGNSIYPLFQNPSAAFTKIAQTKLWDKPGGYMFVKLPSRFWGIVQYYDPASSDITLDIDNEVSGGSNSYTLASTLVMNWTTQTGLAMNWTTQSGAPMIWVAAGINVVGPTAIGQQGVLSGFTVQTNCADMAIISMMIGDQVGQSRI